LPPAAGRFQHYVTKIRKPETPAGEYTVEYRNVATGENGAERFDCVCVCSGLHNVPHVPDIPGLDTFKGAG
jgi:cation diffusion facilitator CzcD-associated flavoprotein CzcO